MNINFFNKNETSCKFNIQHPFSPRSTELVPCFPYITSRSANMKILEQNELLNVEKWFPDTMCNFKYHGNLQRPLGLHT